MPNRMLIILIASIFICYLINITDLNIVYRLSLVIITNTIIFLYVIKFTNIRDFIAKKMRKL